MPSSSHGEVLLAARYALRSLAMDLAGILLEAEMHRSATLLSTLPACSSLEISWPFSVVYGISMSDPRCQATKPSAAGRSSSRCASSRFPLESQDAICAIVVQEVDGFDWNIFISMLCVGQLLVMMMMTMTITDHDQDDAVADTELGIGSGWPQPNPSEADIVCDLSIPRSCSYWQSDRDGSNLQHR